MITYIYVFIKSNHSVFKHIVEIFSKNKCITSTENDLEKYIDLNSVKILHPETPIIY